MKRIVAVISCLALVAVLLSGCSGTQQPQGQVYDEATQYIGPAPTPTAQPVATDPPVDNGGDAGDAGNTGGLFASNPYDITAGDSVDLGSAALSEEEPLEEAEPVGTVYPYAGSTPIPIDPVDMPTPTPRGDLNFVYTTYFVQSLGPTGITFEGPAGWVPDESVPEMFTLSEPTQQLKDGQLGVLNVYAVHVTADYTLSELRTEVKQRVSTIGSSNFSEWSPSLTAERYLMGAEGVYMNYTGTMNSGVKIGGRIHAVCRDKTLYVIQITYPLEYRDDFLDVFAKLRTSIKRGATTPAQ